MYNVYSQKGFINILPTQEEDYGIFTEIISCPRQGLPMALPG
jgi:hypothetical protein